MSDRDAAPATVASGDPVLDQIVRRIVERCDPVRIILFGSRARGNTHEDSDYDIMVEMETGLSHARRRMEIDQLFPRRDWSMDILVFTPEEVTRWQDDIGMVLYDIVRQGVVLYERS